MSSSGRWETAMKLFGHLAKPRMPVPVATVQRTALNRNEGPSAQRLVESGSQCRVHLVEGGIEALLVVLRAANQEAAAWTRQAEQVGRCRASVRRPVPKPKASGSLCSGIQHSAGALKFQSVRAIEKRIGGAPSTSSRLDNTEPTSDMATTSYSPCH